MINLDKKYRIWWEWYTLNIQNDYERDYSDSQTRITDPSNTLGSFESEVYQDILDKIDELRLHPIGEWIDPEDI